MSKTTSVATYVDAETQTVSASNGVDYAYRVTGQSAARPLVFCSTFGATSTTGILRSLMRSPGAAR